MGYTELPSTYDTSKYAEKLWFSSTPNDDTAYFEHDFNDYSLEARVLYNDQHALPWVLSLHGARADITKSDAVTLGLQQLGYSILGCNMSGHSEAGVLAPEQTSLANNIKEARTFFGYLDPNRSKTVIAYSLGGTPALKVLEEHMDDVDKLVLFYPGIYAADAYDKHFGEEFKEAITRPFSYRDNDTIEILKRFRGKLMLVKGQYDGLDPVAYGKPAGGSAGQVEIDGQEYYSPIPKEVIDMVLDAVPIERRQYVEIPDCGHSVVLWMRENPQGASELLRQIDVFLKS